VYERILHFVPNEPSIEDVEWSDIAELWQIAYRIKSKPVFAGKMCHFMFPKIFIVMDNLATQVFDYEFYWRGMKDEWTRFSQQEAAKTTIAETINAIRPIHELYPLETKIMELSHIGYKHG
jgi:hypothetical protein